ncbi:MAG: IS630 family transposase [Anaerolineae bacterium]
MFLTEDEMSMYLQATTMAVWAPKGQTPVVRADPGRAKVCFYGTLDLQTGRDIVARASVMNAEETAQHLVQILEAIPERPILLFWDRAPWHSGQPIRDVLVANPRLEIMRFPVAAPELNPQEHVWKAVRRAVSHNHIQQRLPELADRIEKHLTTETFASSFLDHYGLNAIYPMFN